MVCAVMHAGCSLGVRFWRVLVELVSGVGAGGVVWGALSEVAGEHT